MEMVLHQVLLLTNLLHQLVARLRLAEVEEVVLRLQRALHLLTIKSSRHPEMIPISTQSTRLQRRQRCTP